MDPAYLLDGGIGLGVLLIGIAFLVLFTRVGRTLDRVDATLDHGLVQIERLSVPVGEALDHVGGIMGTVDVTLAKASGVVGALEHIAGNVAKTADAAQGSVTPTLLNAARLLTSLTEGLRRIVMGGNGRSDGHQKRDSREHEQRG
ncbi:MAG: hypothetical protein KGM44_00070 [bacterium]|nr:hypothetical protein [bacterium]